MKKLTLAVVFGSRTCEHEVSIISALQLMEAVDRNKYDLLPVYISMRGMWYTGEKLMKMKTFQPFHEDDPELTRVYPDMTANSGVLYARRVAASLLKHERLEAVARMDVVLPVMHGMHGEDGTLQGMLEMCNLPYTSSGVLGSAVAMDKIMMHQAFTAFGFPVLPAVFAARYEWTEDAEAVIARVESALPYPVFVKPANLGSSIGVSCAHDCDGLRKALVLAFSYDRRALIEKGLNHPKELNCGVLGYGAEATASVLEMPLTGAELLDFSEKYLRGAKGGSDGMASLSRSIPAPVDDAVSEQVRALAINIFKALDCRGVVRIDFMLDPENGKPYVTEINSIPGSMAYYLFEYSGLSFTELIDRMVAYALQAHEEKNETNFAFASPILSGNGGRKGGKLGTKLGGK